jgi:hypothetical protein
VRRDRKEADPPAGDPVDRGPESAGALAPSAAARRQTWPDPRPSSERLREKLRSMERRREVRELLSGLATALPDCCFTECAAEEAPISESVLWSGYMARACGLPRSAGQPAANREIAEFHRACLAGARGVYCYFGITSHRVCLKATGSRLEDALWVLWGESGARLLAVLRDDLQAGIRVRRRGLHNAPHFQGHPASPTPGDPPAAKADFGARGHRAARRARVQVWGFVALAPRHRHSV